MALWRDVTTARGRLASGGIETRLMELLLGAGLKAVAEGTDALSRAMTLGLVRGNKRRGDHEVTLPVADIDLIAEVTEPANLRGAWLQGIGRGRRVGCGMLRIEPAEPAPAGTPGAS